MNVIIIYSYQGSLFTKKKKKTVFTILFVVNIQNNEAQHNFGLQVMHKHNPSESLWLPVVLFYFVRDDEGQNLLQTL